MTPEQERRQRTADLDRAYAGIEIPPLALADLRASAFYSRSTVERDSTGRIDNSATLRNEGARAFLVSLEQRIERAKKAHEEPTTHAVSATAEGS